MVEVSLYHVRFDLDVPLKVNYHCLLAPSFTASNYKKFSGLQVQHSVLTHVREYYILIPYRPLQYLPSFELNKSHELVALDFINDQVFPSIFNGVWDCKIIMIYNDCVFVEFLIGLRLLYL